MKDGIVINEYGDLYYSKNDLFHRLNGPARVISLNEGKNKNYYWWYNGEYIICDSQEYFERIIRLRLLW